MGLDMTLLLQDNEGLARGSLTDPAAFSKMCRDLAVNVRLHHSALELESGNVDNDTHLGMHVCAAIVWQFH